MSETASAEIERVSTTIETAIKECGVLAIRDKTALMQAVKTAEGIEALRNAMPLELVKRVFMPLQGSPLGFLTDRDNPKEGPRGYHIEVVRECIIEGLLRGLRPVNNEMNIIAGRCYAAKNGLERNVREFEGVIKFRIEPGVPRLSDDGKSAVVPMYASWLFHNAPDSLACELKKDGERVISDTRIPVRVNERMGIDGIIGKATRKFYARIFTILSGCSIPEGDSGDADAITTTGESVTDDKKSAQQAKIDEALEQHRQRTAAKKAGQNGDPEPAQGEPAKKPEPEAKVASNEAEKQETKGKKGEKQREVGEEG